MVPPPRRYRHRMYRGSSIREPGRVRFRDVERIHPLGVILTDSDRRYMARCPVVRTPGGGAHLYLRLAEPTKGYKLAKTAAGKCLIEVRGRQHYVVASGSPPACHPTGRTYRLARIGWLDGEPADLISLDVYHRLTIYAAELNEYVRPAVCEIVGDRPASGETGNRPGDHFNRRCDWSSVLRPHGWKVFHSTPGATYWCRPNKNPPGVSASTGFCTGPSGTDLLYVFSTSASPFEAERSYSRFAAYALLNHHGDFTKAAVIAPREGAKSTVVTLAYVLRCAVERLEPYILILSDSADQAAEKLADVRRELEGNPRLAADYPDACGAGQSWRTDRIELRNGVVIQSIGRRGRVRGRRNREARPSLIVFDDVENNTTITSPAERAATWRWATREVIPAGSAGTNYLSVGSALHPQCVALQLGQLAGWVGHRYRAVHRWPDRMDLWDRWERLVTNLADDKRLETAAEFYAANRDEMDRGVEVYWPARWSLYDLMKRRSEIGAAAFDAEYQGIPSTEGLTEWPAEFFDHPNLWFDDWPADLWLRVQALDPSKGADSGSGDYQAHVLVGVDRRGDMYVEAVLAREPIPLMVARAIDLAGQSGFGQLDSLAVENNDSLGMLIPEFER